MKISIHTALEMLTNVVSPIFFSNMVPSHTWDGQKGKSAKKDTNKQVIKLNVFAPHTGAAALRERYANFAIATNGSFERDYTCYQ